MFSSGFLELDSLLGGGYAEKSTVLITGPVGVGKEMLVYHFIQSGIREGDSCVYVTRQSVNDVVRDMKAHGIDPKGTSVSWIAAEGTERKYSPNDLAGLSFNAKEFLRENRAKRTRIVLDSLSSLLMMNSSDSVYRFLLQLFAEVKRYNASLLGLAEEDMHAPSVTASMEQVFDGVLKVSHGEDDTSLVEVRKMTGTDIPAKSQVVIAPRRGGKESGQGLVETAGRMRIAVLPLVSLSADPNDEFFADGLTEELIDRLCQARELEVIARTSVMTYKNKEKKAAEIGKELRVGTLVEGSVRKAGNRIRVTAQLIDANSEGHLWSSRYDTDLQDIFTVQSDIAEKIAQALKLNLMQAEKDEIGKKATSVPEAYIAFLNGVYFRNKGTEVGFKKAIEYFERAVELDPNYAEAYARLGDCHFFLGNQGFEPMSQAISKAKELVTKALALDPTSAQAQYERAGISYFSDWDWVAYEQGTKRALELNPSYLDYRISYAFSLVNFGRKDEAVIEAKKMVDLAPLDNRAHFIAGDILSLAGKFDEAIVEHNKALEIEPNHPWAQNELGLAYLRMGRVAEGVGELEKAMALSGGGTLFKRSLGYGYAISGKREDALKIVADLEQARTKGLSRPYDIAMIFAGLGENSKALDLLEEAFEEHSIVSFPLITVEPAFAGLRTETRFRALLKKLDLET